MHRLWKLLSSWSPHKRHLLQSDSVVPFSDNKPAATNLCEPLCQICGLVVLHAMALPHHVKTVHPEYLLLDKDMTCKLCGAILIHSHAMDHHLRTMHAILYPQAPKKDPIRHVLPSSRAKFKPKTVKNSVRMNQRKISSEYSSSDEDGTESPDAHNCHLETGDTRSSDIQTEPNTHGDDEAIWKYDDVSSDGWTDDWGAFDDDPETVKETVNEAGDILYTYPGSVFTTGDASTEMANSSRRLLAEVSSIDDGHHERDDTTDRPSTSANYTCPACRREFRRASAFRDHFRYCFSNDNPLLQGGRWQCEVCLKRFTVLHQLSMHQSSHQQCDVCKEFPFLNNKHSVKHMKEAHPSYLDSYRPFACRVCRRSFADRLSMSIHLHGTHRRHVEQPCPFCKETLKNNNSEREAHFQTNHPLETLSQCYVCNELFTSVQSILKHRQEHHPKFIMA